MYSAISKQEKAHPEAALLVAGYTAHYPIIPETLDPLQFAYRPNRSIDDAVSIALHTALSHLDKRNTYVRMLFTDYSSVLNTIVPSKLINKLSSLRLNTSLCNWILDFLPGDPGGKGR